MNLGLETGRPAVLRTVTGGVAPPPAHPAAKHRLSLKPGTPIKHTQAVRVFDDGA